MKSTMLLAFLWAGCSTEPVVQPVASAPEPAAMAFRNEAGQLVCPVMGDVIPSEEQAVSHTTYDDTEYYFCCSSCEQAFLEDPDKYAHGRHLERAGTMPGSCDAN